MRQNRKKTKNVKHILISLGILVLALSASAAEQPNIIVILSDDMGVSDIGCYGGEINTPTLDGLAANGLRFSQFYNTGRCCPTRASLLTGLYPHQAGVGHMMNDRGVDGYRGDLSKQVMTIAEVLKTAGYGTYMAGKWHVTKQTSPRNDEDRHNWPLQRGFDRFYGTIHGAGSLWDPNTLTRGNTYITPVNDPKYHPDGDWFYTDAISDNAVTFIKEHKGDAPFFVYVAYTAAHWPMHAHEKDIAKYRGKYDAGYAPIRKARYARMKEIGLIDDTVKLSPQAEQWPNNKDTSWDSRNMEVYAAMVDCMDQGIGKIVHELKRQKKLKNTLIFFMQDNGGCAESLIRHGKGSPRADKPPLPPMGKDELQKSMIPRQSRDGYPVRRSRGVMAGPADTYITYGRGWANVSNTPFREYKHFVHEGGIATPLIVHWPAKINAKGEWCSAPSHLIDIMATCVDVSGANYPRQFKENSITPLEGVSLQPTFISKTLTRQNPLFWEHEKNCALRDGKWKLVGKHVLQADGPVLKKWELYNMETDRSELTNLAAENPERVKTMHNTFTAWCQHAQVLPLSKQKE
jgi:arylsulfatase A-like enzyme